jgi:site-specific recombinase
MNHPQAMIDRLAMLVDRLRPSHLHDIAGAERNIRAEAVHLRERPELAAELSDDLLSLLSLPYQTPFYGEIGIRSGLGFWLELGQRLIVRLLPPAPDREQLRDIMGLVFRPGDHEWVSQVSDESWVQLADVLKLPQSDEVVMANVLETVRVLSYRLSGSAVDRELLRADAALERYESPFLAQNAALIPLLERARSGGTGPTPDEVDHIDVLLDQCTEALERVRRKAGDKGVSVRLTYLLVRMRQLIARMRMLLDLAAAEKRTLHAVQLMRTLLTAQQTQHRVTGFIGENVSLVARNITDHASRHGEHYIARESSGLWSMARSAAGGGIIIAMMAMVKIQLSLLHLPQLTAGIAYGLNYGLGFVLIHLLGFTVATKQPAMTAAAIAATLEESKPRDLNRLGDLVQDVLRTQFVAVLGNVGLALPVAFLLTFAWPMLFGAPAAPLEKAHHLLHDLHPLQSGALFYAAIAGVGLFLSGLVSGYFDNQARYHQLANRIAAAPALARFGKFRATRWGEYIDTHYGAILGNLFFGMYLGLVGAFGTLTGLPIDIRHVAFGSANLGTALDLLDLHEVAIPFVWAALGVLLIAMVNLAVSFSLALYVAMKSRQLGAEQIVRLGVLLLERWLAWPIRWVARLRRK